MVYNRVIFQNFQNFHQINYNEEEETQIYIKWINSLNLKDDLNNKIIINDICENLKDGIIFLKILDIFDPNNKHEPIKNKQKSELNIRFTIQKVLNEFKNLNIEFKGIECIQIESGNKKVILQMLRKILEEFNNFKAMKNELRINLIDWGNKIIKDENKKIKIGKDKTINISYFFEIMKFIEPRFFNKENISINNDKELKQILICNAVKLGIEIPLTFDKFCDIDSNEFLDKFNDIESDEFFYFLVNLYEKSKSWNPPY